MQRLLLGGLICFLALCTYQAPPALSRVAYGTVLSHFGLQTPASIESTEGVNKIRFVGDVMLARSVERLMDQYGTDYPFQHLTTIPSTAYLVGNFEASIPEHHQPTRDYTFRFSVKESAVHALHTAGFTHLSLANNHSYDFGPAAFTNTKQSFADNQLVPFGDRTESATSSLTYVDFADETVALIGIMAVDRNPDEAAIRALFSEAAQKSSYQIVYVHWGTEYTPLANKQQKELAARFVDLGADLIIGHHPHVIQEIDTIAGVPVFYSLGNFIFDQYFSEAVQMGLVLDVAVSESDLSITPRLVTSIASKAAPQFLSAEATERYLAKFMNTDDPDLVSALATGVLIVQR